MPNDPVPPIDAEPRGAGSSHPFEEAEAKLLELESTRLGIENSEANQRIRLRWIAVVLALAVIAFMALVLGHTVHQMFLGYVSLSNSSVSVALVVGPMASITAITLAFFFGAFRKFNDKDVEKLVSNIASAIPLARGQ